MQQVRSLNPTKGFGFRRDEVEIEKRQNLCCRVAAGERADGVNLGIGERLVQIARAQLGRAGLKLAPAFACFVSRT